MIEHSAAIGWPPSRTGTASVRRVLAQLMLRQSRSQAFRLVTASQAVEVGVSLDDIVESGRRFGTELELDRLEPLLARGCDCPGSTRSRLAGSVRRTLKRG